MTKTSNLIIYKASAGSGKTYTLAKEYLKIVILNPYEYRKILAVTFTRKATEEMKTRIIEYLSRLEKKDEKLASIRNSIIEEIQNEKGIDIQEQFDSNVKKALQLILHDYSNFNISTIDSFFQGIIRSFAKELDLPIGMEVELDVDAVINTAVQQVLKDYKDNQDTFSKWLEDFVFDQIEEDKSWRIERNIMDLARQLTREEFHHRIVGDETAFDIELYKKVLLELKKIVRDYQNKLTELTTEVEQKIELNKIDTSLFFQGNSSVQSFIKKTKAFAPDVNSYLQKMLDGGIVYSSSKADTSSIPELEAAWHDYLHPYINEVMEMKEKYAVKYHSSILVLKQIYSLALLANINTRIKEYKSDQNLILISDTNHIVSLIAKHEEVPFIFEKSANFLNYVLIDEFQDTSSLQWTGMLPLLLEILQHYHGMVLIVGDPKQSIYRWRGGKMELIVDGIRPDLDFHWESRKDVPLLENYRSAPEVVNFNNSLFESIRKLTDFRNPIFNQILMDVKQTEKRYDLKGYVECKWLVKDKEADKDIHLVELLSTIHSLEGKKRYRDIAILTRSNDDGALIANFLQHQGIPVVSAESLMLMNQDSIKLLIAAFEYITHSDEVFYRVKLNYLLAKFLQKDNPELYLHPQNDGRYFFESATPFLAIEAIEKWSSVSVLELLMLLLEHLKLDIQTDTYLWRFQDIVLKHTQQQSHSVQDFLAFWEEQKSKLSILPPDGLDAVKIYTIHKSKGLQFPVVIIPYADWSMKPKTNSMLWVESSEPPFNQLKSIPVGFNKSLEESLFAEYYYKELEATYVDNINLLYVAATRAEEQLYVFCKATSSKIKLAEKQETTSKLLMAALTDVNLPGGEWVGTDLFKYGNKNAVKETDVQKDNILEIGPVVYTNFKSQLRLSSTKKYSDAQIRGSELHAILSQITQPKDLSNAVLSTVTEAGEQQQYLDVAQKVIEFFIQQNWFDARWTHLSERGVHFQQKSLRPDKILLSEDECIIIDFKTGAKEKQYIKQVQEYIEAYRSVLTQTVKGYLLYIDTLQLEQVNT